MNDLAWWLTKDADVDCLTLYNKHYSAYNYADGRIRKFFCGPGEKVVLRTFSGDAFLSGEDLKMTALTSALKNDRTALTARRSGTKERIKVQSSFVKRMQLLIASGLVAGITPTSTRRGSSQRILATAFYELGGVDAE